MGASIQPMISGPKIYAKGGKEYIRYNNYVIFKQSFFHLINGKDLYIKYLDEHWDLFKYTPTFAALFGIFAVLPDWLGLNLWNLINSLILLASIYYLPRIDNRKKGIILLILLIELLTSLQNQQSNGLIAGLTILAFGLLEREKLLWATLCIVLSAYIKLFGIVGFAIFLFYPGKVKSILYSILWTVVFFAIPLLFIDINHYRNLFASYWKVLFHDHDISYGFSVIGWLHTWFKLDINKIYLVLTGVIIFLIPFYKIKNYSSFSFKFLTLTSVLIWVVIFNHRAESATFIIAMSGVALWYYTREKSLFNTILFITAFVLTTLSPTDIFPRYLRSHYVVPYALKGVPCIFIWFKIIYDMIVLKPDKLAGISNN
jgi:hypothetical protein